MKKIMSMLLVFSLVFVLGACSQDSTHDSSEDEDYVEEEYTEDEEYDSGNAVELISRGTWNHEDPNGYIIRGEIKTSDLIRASDWDTVESTFDSLNYPEPLLSFDALSPDDASQDTSAVLVGMIELNNATDGWDFTESNSYECRIHFEAPGLNGYNFSSLCVMYGSGMQKYDFGGVIGYLDTNAVMKSNSWKVPFVIVIPNVFTPNEPDGNEQVQNTEFMIYSSTGPCRFMMPGLIEQD